MGVRGGGRSPSGSLWVPQADPRCWLRLPQPQGVCLCERRTRLLRLRLMECGGRS